MKNPDNDESERQQCCFDEPWIGRCKEPMAVDSICCEKHSSEKCSVCGAQATTRCQASIGVMCGVLLCDLCGHGQVCLEHSVRGPLWVIRALLGKGPVVSIFSTKELIETERQLMELVRDRLERKANISHAMDQFKVFPEILNTEFDPLELGI